MNRNTLIPRTLLVVTAWMPMASPQNAHAQETADRADTELLVSTEWLAANLSDPMLVLLHVGADSQYRDEHIPGARLVDMSRVVQLESESGLRNEVRTSVELLASFEELGISDDSRIVVYCADDWVNSTMRVLFTLDHMGLGARTSLLNGGMRQWKAEGRPLTDDVSPVARGTVSPRESRELVVGAAWVAAHQRSQGYAIVDARPSDLYSGERTHRGAREGHIPGARTLPFSRLFDDSGRVRGDAEIRLIFQEIGVVEGDTVVAYCYTGMQATSVLFAARLLGHNVRLYDGSYEEWGTDPELPVHSHNN